MNKKFSPTNKLCIHFPICTGCQALDVPYSDQLDLKTDYFYRLFRDYKKTNIENTVPSPEEYFYRHKVQIPFGFNGNNISLGLHSKDYSHIIDMKECKLQDIGLTQVVFAVKEWAKLEKLYVYDEQKAKGQLKYVLLKKSKETKEILLGIVTFTDKSFSEKQIERLISLINANLSKDLTYGTLSGIVHSINRSESTVVWGEKNKTIHGKNFIYEKIGKYSFKIFLDTFVQVNPYQTENLYSIVLSNLDSGVNIIDAYCGIGTISTFVSEKCNKIIGIESNQSSIKSAINCALYNKLDKIKFLKGETSRILPKLLRENIQTIILDPPRNGLDYNTISKINESGIKKVIYVSCDPITLKRDIDLFRDSFHLKSIQPVDMFPHTDHIESVSVLVRQ